MLIADMLISFPLLTTISGGVKNKKVGIASKEPLILKCHRHLAANMVGVEVHRAVLA